MSISLSIIVASSGRSSLETTLKSITHQMGPGDELLVDVNDDAPWGHAARQRKMEQADGDYLLFQDDDDIYTYDAFEGIRGAISQGARGAHIFRMRYIQTGQVLWSKPELRMGNVSTQMICVPNVRGWLGRWSDRYEGDFDFIQGTCELLGPPEWHEQVISLVHHPEQRETTNTV